MVTLDGPGAVPPGRVPLTGQEFSVDNATDVHVGGEFNALSGSQPLFVRAGAFSTRSHLIRFGGSTDSQINSQWSAIYNTLGASTQWDLTFGLGTVFARSVQVDGAYVKTVSPSDITDRNDFVVSIAYRF